VYFATFFKKENYNLSCKILRHWTPISFVIFTGKRNAHFHYFGEKKPKAKIIFSQERCYRLKTNKQTNKKQNKKPPPNRNRDSS